MSSENLVAEISPQKYLKTNSFHVSRLFLALVILLTGPGWISATSLAGTGANESESPGGPTGHVHRDARHVFTSPLRRELYAMVWSAALLMATFSVLAAGRDFHELYIS